LMKGVQRRGLAGRKRVAMSSQKTHTYCTCMAEEGSDGNG
jgi:hypothetical protein